MTFLKLSVICFTIAALAILANCKSPAIRFANGSPTSEYMFWLRAFHVIDTYIANDQDEDNVTPAVNYANNFRAWATGKKHILNWARVFGEEGHVDYGAALLKMRKLLETYAPDLSIVEGTILRDMAQRVIDDRYRKKRNMETINDWFAFHGILRDNVFHAEERRKRAGAGYESVTLMTKEDIEDFQ